MTGGMSLVDLDALVAELVLRLLDLAEQGLVRLGRVVEAEEAEAERRERVRAERDEEPPRDLSSAPNQRKRSCTPHWLLGIPLLAMRSNVRLNARHS